MEIDPAYFAQAARRVEELEREMSAPGAASNPAVFKELVREHQRLSELGKAAEECQDLELLDLVYKLLVTSGEEAQA